MLKECMNFPRVRPLKGLLFNTEIVGDISKCVCPPYDVIEDPKKYYDMSPYNAIRLELPLETGKKDKYLAAKETLAEWTKKRILFEDSRECIYILEQKYHLDGASLRRIGFFSLLKLDMDMILTHERTKEEALVDRERLLLATQTFASFVFGLYVDEKNRIERLLEESEKELLYSFKDEENVSLSVFRLIDRKNEKELEDLMEEKKIYLADGHHRLKVAKNLGFKYVPIYLTSMFGEGVRILPYNRIIRFRDPKRLKEACQPLWGKIDPKSYKASKASFEEIKKKLKESEKPSFAIMRRDDPEIVYFFEWTNFDEKKLKIQIIHESVIKDLIGAKEDEIDFSPYFEKTIELVQTGRCDMVVFCPPVKIEEVKEISEAKSIMPPKSTFFYPKIPAGPVFYKYG